jgi:hypothetical protein
VQQQLVLQQLVQELQLRRLQLRLAQDEHQLEQLYQLQHQ